jgi:pimeloyl-ACP methyl ester carboxylesterase
MMSASPRYAHCGAVRIAYHLLNESASARPLLMIMGLSGVKEDWHDLPEWLAQDRPVAVFDNRGIGDSDVPDGPYTMEQLAGDALALLDTLGWKQAHVMGISMGGMIAQTLALAVPERVDRLVLGCTSDTGRLDPAPDREVMSAMMPMAGAAPREAAGRALSVNYTAGWITEDPQRFEALIDRSLRQRRRARGILAQINALSRFDAREQLVDLAHAALVLHGDGDRLIPHANGVRLASRLRNARFRTLPGCGHLFWHMDDGQSAGMIRDFLVNGS